MINYDYDDDADDDDDDHDDDDNNYKIKYNNDMFQVIYPDRSNDYSL